MNKKIQKAHRHAWELANGPIPEGLWVLHKCDNPPCLNPNHLFLGTRRDNVQDALRKNRLADVSGEKNPRAKLTKEQVEEIRILVAKGSKYRDLAARFGVSQAEIGHIIRGRSWPEGLSHV